MNKLPIATALLVMGSAHAASLPKFEVTCPTDLAVRADAGGPVFINDKQAILSKFSEQYYEARAEGVTISISLGGDGTPTVSYTGKHGANGMCGKREEQAPAEPEAEPETETQPQG